MAAPNPAPQPHASAGQNRKASRGGWASENPRPGASGDAIHDPEVLGIQAKGLRDRGLSDAEIRRELRDEGFSSSSITEWLRSNKRAKRGPDAATKPDVGATEPSSPPATKPAASSSKSPLLPRAVTKRGGSTGGLLIAVFVYPMALAYLREGPSGLGRWFRAKFLNQTKTDPGIHASASFGPRGPNLAVPAVAVPGGGGTGGVQPAAFTPAGAAAAGVLPSAGGRARVRTGTYNVHQSTNARQTQTDLAKLSQRADVLSLQEIKGGGHASLGTWLGARGWGYYKGAGETAVAWNERRYDAVRKGSAPLNPTHFGKAGLMSRHAAYVLLRDKATGAEFWQVSVHTVPHGDAQHSTGTPAQRAAIEREQGSNMSKLYRELAATGRPVFFGGDMDKATSPIAGSTPDSGRTRVDQILSQLRAVNRGVIKGLFSDHNAVVATYQIGGGTGVKAAAGGGATGASARARGAVAFARAQIGDPYQWAGNGPDRWDCSGLIKAAYAKQGVVLPRTSTAMLGSGRRVARANLRVGDLVWPHVGHVQLVSGAGTVIEAPRTGLNVREVAIGHVWAARRVA